MENLKLIFLLRLASICFVDCKVSWEIDTNPVVIGEDLKLYCRTTEPCMACSSRWTLGTQILSYYDRVIDDNKYTVSMDKWGSTLTIKNFGLNDVNKYYKCSIEFNSFARILTLPETFEHHPLKNATSGSHSLKDRNLDFNFNFTEVHPEPNCSVHLDEENLSDKLKSNKVETGKCLNVEIKVKHKLKKAQSGGRLRLVCSVGTKRETFYDVYLGAHTSNNDPWSLPVTVSVALLGIIIIVSCLSFFIFKHRKQHDGRTRMTSCGIKGQNHEINKRKSNIECTSTTTLEIKRATSGDNKGEDVENGSQSIEDVISPLITERYSTDVDSSEPYLEKSENRHGDGETSHGLMGESPVPQIIVVDRCGVESEDQNKNVEDINNKDNLSRNRTIERANSNSSSESTFNEFAKERYTDIKREDLIENNSENKITLEISTTCN